MVVSNRNLQTSRGPLFSGAKMLVYRSVAPQPMRYIVALIFASAEGLTYATRWSIFRCEKGQGVGFLGKKPWREAERALRLHPGRLTWNIIMEVWKIIFFSTWLIYRFHVILPGCRYSQTKISKWKNHDTLHPMVFYQIRWLQMSPTLVKHDKFNIYCTALFLMHISTGDSGMFRNLSTDICMVFAP